MTYTVQVYDENEVIVACSQSDSLDKMEQMFTETVCLKEMSVAMWVRIFDGPQILAEAFVNGTSLAYLLSSRPQSYVLH